MRAGRTTAFITCPLLDARSGTPVAAPLPAPAPRPQQFTDAQPPIATVQPPSTAWLAAVRSVLPGFVRALTPVALVPPPSAPIAPPFARVRPPSDRGPPPFTEVPPPAHSRKSGAGLEKPRSIATPPALGRGAPVSARPRPPSASARRAIVNHPAHSPRPALAFVRSRCPSIQPLSPSTQMRSAFTRLRQASPHPIAPPTLDSDDAMVARRRTESGTLFAFHQRQPA